MFATGPPTVSDPPPRAGLRLAGAERRVFDGTSALAADPALRRYLSDMVAPYQLALRDDLLDAGAGQSYGEMAEPVIANLVRESDPVDLLLLAYGIHDVRLGRATATYLGSRCPGDPLAFAVCDQGLAAAFTALRLISAYAATDAACRALLIVVEQSDLHYELAEPAPVPDRHAAVALLFERAGAEPVAVRQRVIGAGGRLDDLLAAEVAALAGGRSAVTLILGHALAPWAKRSIVDDVVAAPAGQPYTGLWGELSERLPTLRSRGGIALLADLDATLGYLCTAAVPFADVRKGREVAFRGDQVAAET